jgi:putative DNA primase/helicase
MSFLQQATAGDVEMMRYLQRIAGYCLTGDTSEQALFFLFGPGGNGKSVFLNILTHILGDYAISAPMEMFTKTKMTHHPTELAMLRGARAVIATETEEGLPWAAARVKALTGGDRIAARFMRQDYFWFVPQFKLLFAGNHQPLVQSSDPALRRRFNMLPFTHQPSSPDPKLEDKLRIEGPQILAWALEGCLQWQTTGLSPPAVVTGATAEYFDEQDTFAQWISERCEVDPNHSDLPARLFGSWSEFARSMGEEAGDFKSFSARLKRAGMRRTKSGGIRLYRGVRIKAHETPGGDDGSPGGT